VRSRAGGLFHIHALLFNGSLASVKLPLKASVKISVRVPTLVL